MTDAQFYYTARKRAFGPYKHAMWDFSDDVKGPIMSELQDRFELLFQRLNVVNTSAMVRDLTPTPRVEFRSGEALSDVDVEGE